MENGVWNMTADGCSIDGGERQSEEAVLGSGRREERWNHRGVGQSHAETHACGIVGDKIPRGHPAYFAIPERRVVDVRTRLQDLLPLSRSKQQALRVARPRVAGQTAERG